MEPFLSRKGRIIYEIYYYILNNSSNICNNLEADSLFFR